MKAKAPNEDAASAMLPLHPSAPGIAPHPRPVATDSSPSAMLLLPQGISLYLHLPETLGVLQSTTMANAPQNRTRHQRSATFDATRARSLVGSVIVGGQETVPVHVFHKYTRKAVTLRHLPPLVTAKDVVQRALPLLLKDLPSDILGLLPTQPDRWHLWEAKWNEEEVAVAPGTVAATPPKKHSQTNIRHMMAPGHVRSRSEAPVSKGDKTPPNGRRRSSTEKRKIVRRGSEPMTSHHRSASTPSATMASSRSEDGATKKAADLPPPIPLRTDLMRNITLKTHSLSRPLDEAEHVLLTLMTLRDEAKTVKTMPSDHFVLTLAKAKPESTNPSSTNNSRRPSIDPALTAPPARPTPPANTVAQQRKKSVPSALLALSLPDLERKLHRYEAGEKMELSLCVKKWTGLVESILQDSAELAQHVK